MLKRIGDVTPKEALELCERREADCDNCPYVLFRSYITRKSSFGSTESMTRERVCILDLAEWNGKRIRLKEDRDEDEGR